MGIISMKNLEIRESCSIFAPENRASHLLSCDQESSPKERSFTDDGQLFTVGELLFIVGEQIFTDMERRILLSDMKNRACLVEV